MEKERKLQIIRAAAKRFAKHGLNKTTLDELARDLRIGKSTLYHYFTSKEDIYFSTLRWEVEQYVSGIRDIFLKDSPLREKINEYLSFKEIVFDNYKLILSLFIQLMNETHFEEELKILEDLYLGEENVLKELLDKVNFNKDDLNFTFPDSIVYYTWGIVLNKRINSKLPADISAKEKTLFNIFFDLAVK